MAVAGCTYVPEAERASPGKVIPCQVMVVDISQRPSQCAYRITPSVCKLTSIILDIIYYTIIVNFDIRILVRCLHSVYTWCM